MKKTDCFSPIEDNWEGWELDWNRSSSSVVYAKVPQTDLLQAIDLGWMFEHHIRGPVTEPVDMFLSIDQEIVFI